MTTAWNPFYTSTTDQSHVAEVYWGDWHVYAYCKERGCGWESTRTNHYYADRADHWGQASRHTRKMNRWWRCLARRLFTRTQGES